MGGIEKDNEQNCLIELLLFFFSLFFFFYMARLLETDMHKNTL